MTKPYDQFNNRVYIDSEHARIHDGESFVSGYFWSETESTAMVADNATIVLYAEPSAGMHTIIDVSVGGDCEVYHYEGGSSLTTAATAVTAFNKNRFSNKTSGATISWGTTAATTDLGTAFPGRLIPGGSGGNAIGGQDGGYSREMIFDSDQRYATVVTNRSGGVIPISITYEWYEPGASS